MKLVVMTQSTFFVEEDKILSTLFEEGLENLHLCKPGNTPIYFERLLSLISEDYRKKITVHENFYLKNEFELSGIHLDNSNCCPPEGYKGRITKTCDRLESLKEATKKAKYVFLKDTFDTLSSPNNNPKYSLSQLEEASKKGYINKHVYALGGVSLDTIPLAKKLGFGGVVLCEDLWQKFNIVSHKDYRDLIAHFVKIKQAVG